MMYEELNGRGETALLYPGIALSDLTLTADTLCHRHGALSHVLEINYCKSGRMAWKMGNGNHIYLNPGDFSLHTMEACADSEITLPDGRCQGLRVCVDLREAALRPPAALEGTGLFQTLLPEKFCRDGVPVFLAGNEETEQIFSGFYGQPKPLELACRRVKVLELLLYLAKLPLTPGSRLTEYQSEQMEIVREIHDRLIQNMEQRITIEALSREYLINPTTLKAVFKAVYGTSIAAHVKKHRMEQAARLLRESDLSVAEIAQAVGYDSQSKFAAAFKAFFEILPKEYRKNRVFEPRSL